jgi:purine-binding chemotaxis protein CheW
MAATSSENISAFALDAAEQDQYLSFMLGTEPFAIGILGVREIIQYGGITQVPQMPPFVRGVINLRGAVVPVIDLNARFGAALSAVKPRSCIVIVDILNGSDSVVVGIMVDAVNEVLHIPAEQIEPPPLFGSHIRVDFIQGIGKVDGRFIIVLEASRVLAQDAVQSVAHLELRAAG